MFITHLTRGEHGPEYHMTQVGAWALAGDPDSFREGATAFRNARDWAQDKRDAFFSAANERSLTDMMQVRTFSLISDSDSFRQGATAFRDARAGPRNSAMHTSQLRMKGQDP